MRSVSCNFLRIFLDMLILGKLVVDLILQLIA
jgi:hypothetical protein